MIEKHKGRSLDVPGLAHGAPIPMGAKVGDMIFSSGIGGKDPATGKLGVDAETQARFAFQNMCSLLEQGGASLADVGRVTVYIKDNSVREAVNAQWLKHFPDPHDRPARHVLIYDLSNGMLVQLEIVAVVSR